ncbi:NADP-dependent 3-hydroxy acid dehydrogenase YdfG [Planifilum fimeticola]|jgi:NADP-dependent 3-hydroxy acid dehydrogenase YdfG|uniref:NADP-dependent 3-hydroxy acid dehydrogenase YdfG n=1 Tax=Planifilum fimeticola TaxID=201975 RepID=A0A2T0LD71_9BACL|nr:SDR family NAD(P)-dependent oxidoreductase [Planifilum fimeticola]PRX39985.1 NADP-dependent 3-hydroxy acid dehydrogenase YdfG [Planifilum fimeticola]
MGATDERVAIVTGASKGLGAAITRRFADGGIRVVACARSEDKLREVAESDPARIIPIPCDVTQSRQISHLIDETIRRFGRIDILVNNAGLGRFGKVHELSEEDWDQMMAVNLKGAFLACKYAIPHLIRAKGHIVNISSVAGTVTFPGGGGYCASKFGLMALSDVLTQELKPHEVRVSTLCPGSILTEFGSPKPYALKPEQVAETVWQMVSAPRGVIYNQIIMRPQVPPEMQK